MKNKLDPIQAYSRALYRAIGFTKEDLKKPFVAVANSWSEFTPGHIHLRQLAEFMKAGSRGDANLTTAWGISLSDPPSVAEFQATGYEMINTHFA